MTETPREFYLRAVVKMGNLEVIMGLEFEPRTEDIAKLRWSMKHVIGQAIDRLGDAQEGDGPHEMDVPLSDLISHVMGQSWPGRRYFLEVQHDDLDEGWVQVITPAGWPPKKEAIRDPEFCHCHGYSVDVCPSPLRSAKKSPPIITEEMAVKLANEGAEDFWEYNKRVKNRMWKVKP